jgi:hypothetical protein
MFSRAPEKISSPYNDEYPVKDYSKHVSHMANQM